MALERILALDVGDRRIGLAISDPLGITARALATVDRAEAGDEAALRLIVGQIEREGIRCLLIGDPRLPSGDRGEQSEAVDEFVEALCDALDLRFGEGSPRIERSDESYTTVAAAERLRARGQDERSAREAGILDAEAAAVLLEEWLAGRGGVRLPPPD